MNLAQALVKAKKILGAKAYITTYPRALVGEEREAALAAQREAIAQRTAAKEARDARRSAVLAADPEYQRLKAEWIAAEARVESFGGLYRKRVEIGTRGSLFNSIKADGDNFAEALAALEKTLEKT